MELILNNKNKYDVANESTMYRLIFNLTKYSELDKIKQDMTEDNFKGATLGDKILEYIIPKHIEVVDHLADRITATVLTERKSEMEIMQEQIAELQEVVADLGGM